MAHLTDTQRTLQKTLDIASNSVIAYSAPEVPELGNATPQGLLEEWGRLNEARKAMEKVEKIVQKRFLSQVNVEALSEEGDPSDYVDELRGDNFNWVQTKSDTTRLDQTAAKKTLAEQDILAEHMSTSTVTRNIVKRN